MVAFFQAVLDFMIRAGCVEEPLLDGGPGHVAGQGELIGSDTGIGSLQISLSNGFVGQVLI